MDAGERIVCDRAALIDSRLERGQPRFRALGCLSRVDEADAVAAAHQVLANRQWRRLQRPPERPVDRARVAEVIAHEALDPLARRAAGIAETFGDSLLQLVAEDVVMAPRFEMKDRPHAQQELLGIVERTRTGAAVREQRRVGQFRDRLRAEEIAQPARRFLHVGFELVEACR